MDQQIAVAEDGGTDNCATEGAAVERVDPRIMTYDESVSTGPGNLPAGMGNYRPMASWARGIAQDAVNLQDELSVRLSLSGSLASTARAVEMLEHRSVVLPIAEISGAIESLDTLRGRLEGMYHRAMGTRG
jgi:hypothetical protein